VSAAVGVIKARFNLMVEVTEEKPPADILSTTLNHEGGRLLCGSWIGPVRIADAGTVGTENDANWVVAGSRRSLK